MVQWYTRYNKLHNHTNYYITQILKCSENQLIIKYSGQFQTVSDRLTSQKHPKNAFFMPKNASKNRVFAPFFAKNGQNLHLLAQKTG